MINFRKLITGVVTFFLVAFAFWLVVKNEVKTDEVITPKVLDYEAVVCDSVTIARAALYDSLITENKRITYNWNELRRRLARKEKYAEAPYRVIDTTKQ